jgi:adenylate kinase family enzyme
MENQCQPLQLHNGKIQRQKDQSKYNERNGEGYKVIFHGIPRYRNQMKNRTRASKTATNIAGPSQGYFSCSDASVFILTRLVTNTQARQSPDRPPKYSKNVEIQNQANHHHVNQHA